MSLPNISLTQSNGAQKSLKDYDNQVIVIVNTATKCGLNTQFEVLEDIYQDYKDDGLAVLGFPSNQFKQEDTSNEDMESTCKINFGVTFPLHKEAPVNGEDTQPVFEWVKNESGGLFNDDIKWNFTKFLIDQNGEVVERYAPTTNPDAMRDDIENLLNK